MRHAVTHLDVFGTARFSGNPLAVVHDGDDLSTDQMQMITRWLNLSEVSFLVQPQDPRADYGVRIFTIAHELPFAGHPTLGTCQAWLEAGGTPQDPARIVQECGAGLVEVRPHERGLAFRAPPLLRDEPVDATDLGRLTTTLGVEPERVVDARWIDNGPGWVGLLFASAAEVLDITPDLGAAPAMARFDVGLAGAAPEGADHDLEVRALFSDGPGTIREDPATGSLAAGLGGWLTATGRLPTSCVLRQGTAIGRDARLHVERTSEGTLWVGGSATPCLTGHLVS